jgi:hypothetical protein
MGRFLTFAAIVSVAAFCIYSTYVASALPSGNWGVTTAPASRDARLQRVTGVFPHSQAARAGIVRGDIIRVIAPRAFFFDFPAPGARMSFEIRHGAVKRVVVLTAQKLSFPLDPTENILFAAEIIGLLLASLLTWRRWNDPVARPLLLFLVLQAATLSIGNLPDYIYGYVRAPQAILIFLSYAALIRFTAIYPAEVRSSRLRREFATWAPAAALAAGVIFAALEVALDWFNYSVPARVEYRYASLICANALPLLGLAIGVFSAPAPDRRRLTILIGFFLVGISGPIAYNVILARTLLLTYEVRPLLATLILMNVGFVYMILRHRMFDIAFVLNRAAIYAILTTIFLPLFALLEWLAERYILGQNRAANALVQVGIALVLFISIRRFHVYTEYFVDRWLFHERHENETALRDFARHVGLMTEPQAIAEQTTRISQSRTGASWTALYTLGKGYELRSHAGDHLSPVTVNENDFAVAAMRSDRSSVEHVADSALQDALVLPFVSHGKLTGFLACGPKMTAESYAPDERDALAEVARSVGMAFDGLRLLALEDENARLRAQYGTPQTAM